MVQIKLSIAFVLAAAAIAPIVAHPIAPIVAHHPIREPEAGHEHEGRVGPHRHSHRHEHEHADEVDGFHHEHHEEPGYQGHHHFRGPQDLSTGSNTPPLSPREYFDEFDVRDLLSVQNGVVNSLEREEKTLLGEDASLRRQHQTLERENAGLEQKDRHLKHKEEYLENKDHHLGSEVRKLKHERHSLETQDQALDGKKHHLLAEDKTLSVKDKNLRATERLLTAKDRKLALKGKGLALKNKALAKDGKVLARKDRALKLKGKGLTQKDKLLSLKGKILAHDNKELAQQGKDLENKVPLQSKIPLGHGPVVHPKPEILTREYVEFDEMFERALGDVESGSSTVPRPSHFRIGTEVLPHRGVPRRGLGVPRRGLGVPRRGPFSSPFGHGPVEFPHHRSPIIGHGGPYYGPRPEIPSEPKLVTREYAEFDDMFERDLEDIEFDARDFDALYLD